jgi:hypothetical protein
LERYRRPVTAPIRKEIERRLRAHFHLAHHVWENLQRRLGADLSTKPKHRDDRDRAQNKNHNKSTQHV